LAGIWAKMTTAKVPEMWEFVSVCQFLCAFSIPCYIQSYAPISTNSSSSNSSNALVPFSCRVSPARINMGQGEVTHAFLTFEGIRKRLGSVSDAGTFISALLEAHEAPAEMAAD
jgi:hypothetical protein